MYRHSLWFILALLLFGCGNSSNKSSLIEEVFSHAFIHETSGLLNDKIMHIDQRISLHLESTQTHINDTQGIGFDTYKVNVSEEHTREYCLKNSQEVGHRYTMEDAQGTILLNITQGCATINLAKGIYTHKIYNGNKEEDASHRVFVYHNNNIDLTGINSNASVSNKDSDSSQKKLLSRQVENTPLLKQTTLSFNACRGCNLSNTDLSKLSFDAHFTDSDLSPLMNEAYFHSLDTSKAEFFEIQNHNKHRNITQALDMQEASLYAANLSYSIFRNANFSGVDFTDANLSHAVFIDCTFKGAKFHNVDMKRTVFKNADFSKTFTSPASIVSQPSITRLFTSEKTSYADDIIVAINANNRVVLSSSRGGTIHFTDTLSALPYGASIVSPATVSTNNFSGGYSVFVKGSDGYIYEYFKHGNVRGSKARVSQTWYKLANTDKCKSNPDVTFKNFGGSGFNELYNIVACHDKKGTLHTWKRYFYNKPTSQTDSYYSAWSYIAYTMPITDKEISITRYSLAYIEKGNLVHFNYTNQSKNHKAILASSRVDLWTESDNGLYAYIGADGHAYTSYGLVGSPMHGIISAPAIGSLNTSAEPLRVIVLSGDGKLYATNLDGSDSWYIIASEQGSISHTFAFTNNNLTEAYIEKTDLSNLNLSSNILTKTFFTQTNLNKSIFENMQLHSTTFDAIDYFNDVSFKKSTLNNVSFTNNKDEEYSDHNNNNKNIINPDFTGSNINGLIWTNNIAKCPNFNTVTFGDKTVFSHENRFIGGTGCSSGTFRGAKNIPLELVLQADNIRGYGTSRLSSYDFSSASFSPSFYTLNFKDADMTDAKFGATDSSSPSVNFKNIDATGSTWSNADLSYLVCDGCIFDNAHFDGTTMYQVNLNNSSFINSVWHNINASSAKFQNATLDGLSITGASSIQHTSFNSSSLIKSHLRDRDLSHVSFVNADLSCSDMESVNFNATDFSDAYLSGANLSRTSDAHIDNATFNKTDFSGANFTSVTFGNSSLYQSTFDFSGNDVIYNPNTKESCTGHKKPPNTTSNTTCPDGNEPSQGNQCKLN